MIKAIRNLFKVARLLSTMDGEGLRTATVQTMGKNQQVMLFTPYGLMHNPPPNSMALVWSQQGHESNGISMADDPANRTLKNLNPGEVALGNYSTGAYIFFDEQGTCHIQADNINLVCDGSLTAIAETMSLTATSSISLVSPNLSNNGINVGDTHVHSQDPDSAGNTEQDTGGPH